MAIVRFEGDEREVPDGEQIVDACEELGVPFGCQEGECGTCRCTVIEGMEYLGERNEREETLTTEEDERLACQCRISGGVVELAL